MRRRSFPVAVIGFTSTDSVAFGSKSDFAAGSSAGGNRVIGIHSIPVGEGDFAVVTERTLFDSAFGSVSTDMAVNSSRIRSGAGRDTVLDVEGDKDRPVSFTAGSILGQAEDRKAIGDTSDSVVGWDKSSGNRVGYWGVAGQEHCSAAIVEAAFEADCCFRCSCYWFQPSGRFGAGQADRTCCCLQIVIGMVGSHWRLQAVVAESPGLAFRQTIITVTFF